MEGDTRGNVLGVGVKDVGYGTLSRKKQKAVFPQHHNALSELFLTNTIALLPLSILLQMVTSAANP